MYLHHQKTQIVGTVRERRKDMPSFPKKSKKGEICLKHHCPMLAVHWRDRQKVNLLTTVHKGAHTDSSKVNHRTREVK